MDELALLAEMRREIPADATYDTALRALTQEMRGSGRPAPRRTRRPVLLGGILAGAVAAGALVTIVDLNSGNDRHAPPTPTRSQIRLVAVTSPQTLADNAAVVARPFQLPASKQWIYTKEETTTSHRPPSGAQVQDPGTHTVREKWARVDFLAFAGYEKGKLDIAQGLPGSPYGWPTITYSYLASLPTDPAALLQQIRHNLATEPNPDHGETGDAYVFESVQALVENYTVLPPKLNAALYGVLARLKTVRFSATKDIAGRRVFSLYQISEDMKQELLIDPSTYAYAGQRITMVRDHTGHGDDGTLHRRKGQILDNEAVLVAKIVNTPGARS